MPTGTEASRRGRRIAAGDVARTRSPAMGVWRLLSALVLCLAAAGALLAVPRRPWAARLVPSPARRAAYGAFIGAAVGLLLIPALGLVAALAFLLTGIAVLAAAAVAFLVLGRAFSGRR